MPVYQSLSALYLIWESLYPNLIVSPKLKSLSLDVMQTNATFSSKDKIMFFSEVFSLVSGGRGPVRTRVSCTNRGLAIFESDSDGGRWVVFDC